MKHKYIVVISGRFENYTGYLTGKVSPGGNPVACLYSPTGEFKSNVVVRKGEYSIITKHQNYKKVVI